MKKIIQSREFLVATLASALLSFPFIAFVKSQELSNADDLIPSLIAREHWTPFYWGVERLGSLLPLLTIFIKDISNNLLVQNFLHIFLFLFFIFIVTSFTVREKNNAINYFSATAMICYTALNPQWAKDFVSVLPYGASFGIAIFTFLLIDNKISKVPFLATTTILLFTSAWLNPLVGLHFIPLYISIFFIKPDYRKRIICNFIILLFSGLAFALYGMFHGEIRGFSNPALKQFTQSFWYLGLLVVQCTHLITILIKSAWLKVDKLEIKLFLSTLSVWPIFLLLSATNHVKASLYMPRYFIPVAAVAMALSISFLVQYHFRLYFVFLKHLKNWIETKFIKLLIFALVGGLLATNYLIVREQLSVIPVAEPYQSAVKSALKDLKNPKFVVGDYWYSYPMKLFINNSDKFPVVSNFYMEDQKIFQKENRNRLLDSFAERSRGICFGSFAECQIQFNKLASVLMDKYFLNFKLKEVSVNNNKPMPISIVEIDSLSESKSKCWNGAQLNSVVGRISKNEIVGDPEKSGFLTFGPYIGVGAGEYMYTLTYISNGPTTEIGSYDMVLGSSTFGPFKPVLGSNNVEVQLKTTFRVGEGVSPRDDLIEFRFITNGSQLVTVKSLCVTKIK